MHKVDIKIPEKKLDVLMAQNLVWILYTFILTVTFLVTIPSWELFAVDLVVGILPLAFNLTWIMVATPTRQMMVPDGYWITMFHVMIVLLEMFYCAFIFAYFADMFGHSSKDPLYRMALGVQNAFLIALYLTTCI